MTKQNETKKATKLLRQKLKELGELLAKGVFRTSEGYHYHFRRWYSETEYILIQIFGEKSRELKRLEKAVDMPSFKGTPAELSRHRRKPMLRASAELEAILSSIEEYGMPEKQEGAIPPQVFIAHGGETKALRKLRKFVAILGIAPLTAEEEPSEGRSVDEQVEWCLGNSDCAIILGTSDDKNLKDGKLYPRPNVCIEIGRIQERFPGKVIYLLEEGASFPSNITEKVYERFTQDNMEEAFLKTAKELKAFGIIKATAIRRQHVQDI